VRERSGADFGGGFCAKGVSPKEAEKEKKKEKVASKKLCPWL
jgi:hypothetical protein